MGSLPVDSNGMDPYKSNGRVRLFAKDAILIMPPLIYHAGSAAFSYAGSGLPGGGA
jgi:hypothetical protein